MKKRSLSRRAFLLAAEYQFLKMEDEKLNNDDSFYSKTCEFSRYSCDNLGSALISLGLDDRYISTPEHDFYQSKIMPDNQGAFGWWPYQNDGKWDHESRILALLLCAEMLRR